MIRKTHTLYLEDSSAAEMKKLQQLILDIAAMDERQKNFDEYVTTVSKEKYVVAKENDAKCYLVPTGYAIKAKGLTKVKFGLFMYSFMYEGAKYVSMKGKKTGEFFGYVMAEHSKESKPSEIPPYALFDLNKFTNAVNGDKVYVKHESKIHTFIYDSGQYLSFQDVLNAINKQKKKITCIEGQSFYDTHVNLEGVDVDVVSQIASMICHIGGDAVKEYNLEAYKGLSNFEKILLGGTPNVFKVKPDDYVAYLVGLTTALERFVNADGKVMAINEPGKMRDFIKALRHEEIKKFSLDKKVHILTVLSEGILSGYFGNMGESRVLEVLRTIKPSEELSFLTKIALNGLIYKLINKIDGDNFTDLSFALTLMVLNNKPIPSLEKLGVYSGAQATTAGYVNKKMITYHKNAFKEDQVYRSHSESTKAQFRISWHSDRLFSNKEDNHYTTIKFDEFVVLDIGKQGLKYLGIEGEAQIVIPGVFLHWILKQQQNEDTWAKARLTVEVIFTLLSLGEYAAARTAIAAIVAATDVAVGVTAIFVDGSDMRHNKEYKEFVAVWDKFLMIYGITRGLSILAKISPQRLEQFKKTFNKYKDKIKPKYRKQVETGFTKAEQEHFLKNVHNRVEDGIEGGKKVIESRKISERTIEHSGKGDFANPANPKKSTEPGTMKGGGHGQDNVEVLKTLGRDYEVTYTYQNGVRIGNITRHKNTMKTRGSNQSWFPEDWTDVTIKEAGDYVIKKNIAIFDKLSDGKTIYGNYKNVRVGVMKTKGKAATIFPDGNMQPIPGAKSLEYKPIN